MRIISSSFVTLFFLQVLYAQQPVPPDREALLRGEGRGLAAYAERNGYPGPKHVLELKDTLRLTNDQIQITEALVARVKGLAQNLGAQIVGKEEQLSTLFAGQSSVDENMLRSVLQEIGLLRSDLRFVHLQAHLEMKEALNPDQRHLYTLLRGHETTGHH